MKRPGIDGGLLPCFGINLALNAAWAVPGIVLLVAHALVGGETVPLWWGLAALALWIAIVFGITVGLSALLSLGKGANRNREATRHYSSQRARQAQAARTFERAGEKMRASASAPEEAYAYDVERNADGAMRTDRPS